MKPLIVDVFPQLAEQAAAALRKKGCEGQACALATARIERRTTDDALGLGYIYLVQQVPVRPDETPARTTLVFMWDEGFNIDLRESGEVYGIEIIKLDRNTTKMLYV